MNIREKMDFLARSMDEELKTNILPFWYQTMDRRHGGFFGKVRFDGSLDVRSSKGLVLHAGHLWGYSQAWLHRRNPLHLVAAKQAYDFLTSSLYDKEQRGFWWTVDSKGHPDFEEKLLRGQAFAVYSLTQYFLASGVAEALELAYDTFYLIEKAGRDWEFGGYYEAVDRDWSRNVDKVLAEGEVVCAKSMNTNLHLLEAYTSLYKATGSAPVREALESLLKVFLKHILLNPEHVGVYFDRTWKPLTDHESFGHDIEASWLMTEAAQVLYGLSLPEEWKKPFVQIAERTLKLVLENGGSLPRELHLGRLDTDRAWWVQAEAIIGLVNAFELSGQERFLEGALQVWDFVRLAVIDRTKGEWHALVDAQGRPVTSQDKGGLWKTGCHNGRACTEILRRAARL